MGEGVECLNISLEFSHFIICSCIIFVPTAMVRSMLLKKNHFSLPPFLPPEKSSWIIKLHFLCDGLEEGENLWGGAIIIYYQQPKLLYLRDNHIQHPNLINKYSLPNSKDKKMFKLHENLTLT